MDEIPQHCTEAARLEVLHALQILDTPPEQAFDDITKLAAQICGTPIALVSLVDESRQWFKAKIGLEASETPRWQSFCAHALAQKELLIVPDASLDPRFSESPLVTGEPHLRFYAGMPLVVSEGAVVGTLCVLDRVARRLTDEQKLTLEILAREVVTHLEMRRREAEREASEIRYRQLFKANPQPMWVYDRETLAFLAVNAAAVAHYGYSHDEFLGMTIRDILIPEDEASPAEEPRPEASPITRHRLKDGRIILVETSSNRLEFDGRPAIIALVAERTAREQAAAALAAEQLRQKEILESVGVGIHGLDRDGLITFENTVGSAMLGWHRKELIGRDFHSLIHHRADGSVHPKEDSPIFKTLRDGVVRHTDNQVFFRKDGSSFPVDYICSPVRDESGEITGAVVSFRDITAARETGEQLEHQSMLLRIAGQAARIGGWALYLVPELKLAWSDEVRAIHEAPPEFAPSLDNAIDFYLPEDREEVARHVTACARDGTPFDFEKVIITANGQPRWVRAIGEAARDRDNHIIRVQGAFQDISDQKAAERSLAASDTRFRQLAESMPMMVWSANADGEIEYSNHHLFEYTGTSPKDNPASHWKACLHPDDLQRCLRGWERSVRSGTPFAIEYRMLRHADRRYRWFSAQALPVRDEENKRIGWYGTAIDIHESKRLEQRATKLANRFATTLESFTDAFFTVDHEWIFTYLNSEAERLLERPRRELLGRNLWREFHDAVGSKFYHEYHRALVENVTVSFEEFYPPLNKWLDVRAYPSTEGLAVYLKDVTKRRINDEQLRLLETCISRLNDMILITEAGPIDLPGPRIVYVNDAFSTHTGYTRGEVIGLTPRLLQGPKTQRETLDRIRRGMEAKLPVREELINYKKSGQEFWAEIEITPVADPAGNITHMVSVQRDISGRKFTEQKLREQAALLDQARDAILVRGLDHRIRYWNKGAERLYGWTSDEVRGSLITGLLYDDPSPFVAATETAIQKGEWNGELEQLTRDGVKVTVEGRWTLLRDATGNPEAILAINTDVTHRKKLEHQFLRAQRMESIGTLAGGIAHDLNNVLAPIMMSIELLRMGEDDPMRLEILSMIESSAARGANMVKQVLTFARGVEGRKLDVKLGELIDEVCNIATETFLLPIRISTNVPTDLWSVRGDPTQLHQVLLNLCVNARDAMPEGGDLTLSAKNLEISEQPDGPDHDAGIPAGRYVLLEVEDSGIGMSQEVADRAFEPFFTTKPFGQGTGIGLSTTHAIVTSHGGFIQICSQPGQGTTFRIHLPATESVAPAVATDEADELPLGNDELILLVDDENEVREVTSRTLQAFGYRVLSAADGADALILHAAHPGEIALVLTDMMMPGIDGPSMIRSLRARDPELPVIATSGVHPAPDEEIGHFLPKPYSTDALLRLLRKVLDE